MSKRKKLILYASPLVTVLVLAMVGKVHLDRLQAEADTLAQNGRAVANLFKECAAAIRAHDREKVSAYYDAAYDNPEGGAWTRRLRSDRDGVRAFEWVEEEWAEEGGGQDRDAITAQVVDLVAGLTDVELVKFKVSKFEQISSGGPVRVRSVLWVRGTDEAGHAVESFQHFRVAMVPSGSNGALRITRQELLRGEVVVGKREGFDDVTAEAGIDFRVHMNPDWYTPEWDPKMFGIVRYANAGVSTADYDGDGFYDLYYADGTTPTLYRNQGDGTFVDATAEAGLPTELIGVNAVLFADFDNDGDQDLFVTRMTKANRLYRNDGDGTFTDVTDDAGPLGGEMVTVAAAGDYDNDGDLDIYYGRYLDPRVDLPTTLFYTRNSAGNTLLRNDGGLRFTDVTEEAGVREGGLALGVGFADVDGDRDQDIYVSNDFGRNALLRNNGDGTFTDVSFDSDAVDFGYGMSVDYGDVDNDGDFDIYVSNVHSGQRWYGQAATLRQYLVNSVQQGTIFEDFSLYRKIFEHVGSGWADFGDRFVKGSSLLINDGKGNFTDVSEKANANPYGWYWTSSFFDYDNDGRLDIYASNGWISGKTHDDL